MPSLPDMTTPNVAELARDAAAHAAHPEAPAEPAGFLAAMHELLGDCLPDGIYLECTLARLEPDGRGTVVPVTRGRIQYACARYGATALGEAEAALQRGGRALKSACDRDCAYLPEFEWRRVAAANALDDIDTPEDLARSMQP